MADAFRGHAPDSLFRGSHRERDQPALRRCSQCAASQLDFPRFLWPLLSGAPTVYGFGSAAAVCQANGCGFIPLHGERDEESQFGVSIPFRGWVFDADTFRTRAPQFFRSRRAGRIESLFSAHHRERPHPRMGGHPALAAHRPPRPASPCLFQPDCPGRRSHHRRSDRFFSLDLRPARSRPAQHAQLSAGM